LALFAVVICLLFLGLWFLPTHAFLWSIKTVNGSKYPLRTVVSDRKSDLFIIHKVSSKIVLIKVGKTV